MRSLKVLGFAVFLSTYLPSLVNAQAEQDGADFPTNGTTTVNITTPDSGTFPMGSGSWATIGKTGVPGVHLALIDKSHVMIINRVDTPSPFLPGGTSPFTSLYDLSVNNYSLIPFLRGQPGCATGVFLTNGTLVTTGGKIGGQSGSGEWVRSFTLNTTLGLFNRWYESFGQFTSYRWYSSAALMPDGTILFVGGSLNATININLTNPTYEFLPNSNPNNQPTYLPFLMNNAPWVLYPAVYVIPDGNIWIFVNTGSQIWNPYNNSVVKALPNIPGSARSYPLTGNTIMLPMKPSEGYAPEFMVCGGSSALNPLAPADPTCGRLRPMDPNPQWEMDTMPYKRLMPDSVVLPNGKIIIINGAETGFAGYGKTSQLADIHARDPVYNPVQYDPDAPLGSRWTVLPASTLARMYHSTAITLPDGRVFVAGSSSNDPVCVTQSVNCTFPTLFDAEAFSPDYFGISAPVPVIQAATEPWILGYGRQYQFLVTGLTDYSNITGRVINTGFTTHSSHFDQRAVNIDLSVVSQNSSGVLLSFTSPPNTSVIPPAPMYYLYVVSAAGKPSVGWHVSFNLHPESVVSTPAPTTTGTTTTTSSASPISFSPFICFSLAILAVTSLYF